MLSTNVLNYGREETLPERLPLQAGPLSLIYEGGDLRYVRLGNKEIVRRIYVAIRDRNWGTVPNTLTNVQINAQADSFTITYDVANKQGEIDFRWRATITGDSQGLRCQMDGEAHTTFLRNRIGFCILHPSASASDSCTVEHVDGATETAPLPVYIVPDQPVLPFAEMQGLIQDLGDGVQAVMRFDGDIFEMEDQRNWTDASFKTFSTPLRIPYPVEVPKGTKVTQSFTLALAGYKAVIPTSHAVHVAPTIMFSPVNGVSAVTRLPRFGLGLASHSQSLNEQEIERLKALQLHHLRVDLRLAAPGYIAQLDHATRDARALGVKLEIALLLSPMPEAEAELRQLRSHLERLKTPVGIWLIFPAREMFNTRTPAADLLAAARQQLADYAPGVQFGGGTNADFIFFNRFPIDPAHFDALTITTNPTVHAIDNASVVETLAAQGTLVQSAQRLAGGKPLLITPVTLKMRHNPYATAAPPPLLAGELPPQVDVRQMSLFGAGWTLGSIKYLAENGVSSATYYETTGWRGVMETAYGSNVPEKFRAFPGGVFPMYHIFADVSEFAAGEVIPAQSSQPLSVDGLILRQGDRSRVLLANLTDTPQRVTVTGLPAQVQVRLLDETNAEAAMQAPEEWRGAGGEGRSTDGGRLTLALRPYAIARIDG